MATVSGHSAEQAGDEVVRALSAGIASLHRRSFGRGPRRVRLHVFGDVLVAVLEGFATQSELTLRDQGRGDLVVAGRAAALPAIEDELRALVESTLLRGVAACMVAADPGADVAALVVSLEPRDPDLRSRARRVRQDSEDLRDDTRALRAQARQALRHASEVIERHSR
jgi:uncharacterized protein YbcI